MQITVGDIGTDIELTVIENGVSLDISSATVKQFVFRKPDGTDLTVTAQFKTDGTDGALTYSTVDGDISRGGDWYVEAALTMPSWSGRTQPVGFTVLERL